MTLSIPRVRRLREGVAFLGRLARRAWAPMNYLHVFFFAFLLRWIYLEQAWARNEILGFPIVDASVYVQWAHRILEGSLRWYEPSNYTPAFPLYLSIWFRLLGEAPRAIFLAFHLLGAAQAVVIGKTAGALWNRKAGLIAGLLAAGYWPFIVHEATFFVEPFALWTLSIALYAIVAWVRTGAGRWLWVGGFGFALAGMGRVNAFLGLAAVAAWMLAQRWRQRRTEPAGARAPLASARPLVPLLLPTLLLSAPLLAWNYRLTGVPMLRTQAASCLYLGNNPDRGGLIVPPGIEWQELEHAPLRAGHTLAWEKERFWTQRTMRIVRGRTGAWGRLQGVKLLRVLGRFEVSQEIDIRRFRSCSSVLRQPIWPDWGWVFPLAIGGIWLSRSRRETAALPHLVFAGAYLLSIFPFQVGARFRLALVPALIPFAAGFIAAALDTPARPARAAVRGGILALAGLLLLSPDWTSLRRDNRIDHWLFVGRKRLGEGDAPGAAGAFRASAAELPDRVDSLVDLAFLHLSRGRTSEARHTFRQALLRMPECAEAERGLAACDVRDGRWDDALPRLERVLARWPNHMESLRLLETIYLRQENWEMLENVLLRIQGYVNWPADTGFLLARVREIRGQAGPAVALYAAMAEMPRLGVVSRSRAALYAGIMHWRVWGDRAAAVSAWEQVARLGDPFFSRLAGVLLGRASPDSAAGGSAEPLHRISIHHAKYALAVAAWMKGDLPVARRNLVDVLSVRDATRRKISEMNHVEFWASRDLGKVSDDRGASSADRGS